MGLIKRYSVKKTGLKKPALVRTKTREWKRPSPSAALVRNASMARKYETEMVANLSDVLARTVSKTGGADPALQSGSGIAPIVRVKQKYFEQVVLGDGATSPYPYTFRLNSTYDPNETGTGHQPKGRDFYASMYNDYIVLGGRYIVRFMNIGDATAQHVFTSVETAATVNRHVNDNQTAIEAVGKYVKAGHCRGYNQSLGDNYYVISGKWSAEDFVQGGQSMDEMFTAGVGTNPSTPIRLHLNCAKITGAATAASNMYAEVFLELDVVYKTPIADPSS